MFIGILCLGSVSGNPGCRVYAGDCKPQCPAAARATARSVLLRDPPPGLRFSPVFSRRGGKPRPSSGFPLCFPMVVVNQDPGAGDISALLAHDATAPVSYPTSQGCRATPLPDFIRLCPA